MLRALLVVTAFFIFHLYKGQALNCSMCNSMRDLYCKSSPPVPRECAPTYNACAVVTIYDSETKEMLGMERNCGMDGVEGRDGTCVSALSPHFRTRVVRCYSHCFTDGCNGYTSLFHFLNLHKKKRNFAYDYPLP